MRPSGFSVAWDSVPHNDLSQAGAQPAEPPWVSARGATWSSPGPPWLRTRGATDGRLFHHALGPSGAGYAICLRCGAAEAMHRDGEHHALHDHRPLRYPTDHRAHKGLCKGNAESFAIITGRAFGGFSPTDVFELQLREPGRGRPMTRAEVTSLAVALRQALAEQLGIDVRELGVAITSHIWDHEPYPTITLYDTAAGGAGYAPRAADDVLALLGRSAELLECPNGCDRACHGCLLSFDTDRLHDDLDRLAALTFLAPCLAALGLGDTPVHSDRF